MTSHDVLKMFKWPKWRCCTVVITSWAAGENVLDCKQGWQLTRFAWWRQGLHAIELLRAHIGEWTITQMLDYWRVMCFTGYWLNWNPWIWIPFPVHSDRTLLYSQVDRTRYSSIASGNNCIVQLCKWLCFITPLVGSVDSPRVLVKRNTHWSFYGLTGSNSARRIPQVIN
jgi:hypothetical protein